MKISLPSLVNLTNRQPRVTSQGPTTTHNILKGQLQGPLLKLFPLFCILNNVLICSKLKHLCLFFFSPKKRQFMLVS